MSLKKTSILALSVLLAHESFAASPTVRATTPRLGTATQTVSSSRGKVTPSVSIGSGLNKLTSNRGQSSFTPGGLPSDKQNELIENFQKEIQAVRDAVAEELQAQNDKIRDLEATIEEKDEKIAELEDSLKEEIKNSGFITAESVASDILTAKNEAVAQAKTAALAEVEKQGFATTVSVQNIKAEITNERNAALRSYAKSADVTSEVAAAKTEAIAGAKTAAIAEVRDMGFATAETMAADIAAVKTEITNERNAALMSYAKSADVATEVTAAKTEAISAANTAIAAEATARQAVVATLATKAELQELELGVDAEAVAGIIDGRLVAKKIISEDTLVDAPAFAAVKQQIDAMPATYAKASEVESLEQDLATVDGKFKDISDTIADDLLADNGFKSGVLESLGDDIKELPDVVADLGTRLAGLEGSAEETDTRLTTLNGRFTNTEVKLADPEHFAELLKNRFILHNDFGTKADAWASGKNYATKDDLNGEASERKTALTALEGELTKFEWAENFDTTTLVRYTDLNGYATAKSVDDKFANISGTIADTLLEDNSFKSGVLESLGDDIKTLPGVVADLSTRLAGLEGSAEETDTRLTTLNGRFTNTEVKLADPEHFAELLKNRFILHNDFGTKADAWASGKNYATKDDLNGEASERNTALTDLNNRLEKFEWAENFDTTTLVRFTDFNADDFWTSDRLGNLRGGLLNDATFTGSVVLSGDFGTKADAWASGKNYATKDDLNGEASERNTVFNDLNNRLEKFEWAENFDTTTLVRYTDLNGYATAKSVDDKFANISGTIADTLLEDNSFKSGVLESLGDDIKTLPGVVADLSTRLAGLEGSAEETDTRLTTLNGRFTNTEVKLADPEHFAELLKNRFILHNDFGTKADAWASGKNYATKDDVNGEASERNTALTDLNNRLEKFEWAENFDTTTLVRFTDFNADDFWTSDRLGNLRGGLLNDATFTGSVVLSGDFGTKADAWASGKNYATKDDVNGEASERNTALTDLNNRLEKFEWAENFDTTTLVRFTDFNADDFWTSDRLGNLRGGLLNDATFKGSVVLSGDFGTKADAWASGKNYATKDDVNGEASERNTALTDLNNRLEKFEWAENFDTTTLVRFTDFNADDFWTSDRLGNLRGGLLNDATFKGSVVLSGDFGTKADAWASGKNYATKDDVNGEASERNTALTDLNNRLEKFEWAENFDTTTLVRFTDFNADDFWTSDRLGNLRGGLLNDAAFTDAVVMSNGLEARFGTMLKTANLSENSNFSTLSGNVNTLSSDYGTLSETVSGLNTTVSGFGNTYATKDSVATDIDSITDEIESMNTVLQGKIEGAKSAASTSLNNALNRLTLGQGTLDGALQHMAETEVNGINNWFRNSVMLGADNIGTALFKLSQIPQTNQFVKDTIFYQISQRATNALDKATTNATNIATNAENITANATSIATNATDITTHQNKINEVITGINAAKLQNCETGETNICVPLNIKTLGTGFPNIMPQ